MELQGKVTLENILLDFSKSWKWAFRVVENAKNRHFLTKLFFCNNPRTFKASFPYTSSPHCVVYNKTNKISPRPPPGKLWQLPYTPQDWDAEKIKFMIKYSLEMRNHRFFGNGISNFMSEMTTSGARDVFIVLVSTKYHLKY